MRTRTYAHTHSHVHTTATVILPDHVEWVRLEAVDYLTRDGLQPMLYTDFESTATSDRSSKAGVLGLLK